MPYDHKFAMIPADIYRGAQRAMRRALLDRFADGTRMLKAEPVSGHIQLLSTSVASMTPAEARRELDRCTKVYGSFEELPRVSKIRVWRPLPWLHERLRQEALDYWKSVGYEIGVPRRELPEGAGKL
ncbi:hypothetical protein ACOTHJ_13120 [Achromobacter xylosoxidans]|uniref:hypothetical protein n=1 Tax=Achromobacter anxifer TaxID=1287737 RepID=UPI00155BBA32|nr:hypothetical protein [Achromobacter anxifer]CAB5514633.1 hypothetical protein LMG26857_03692 [Achromobacter anxifer]